MSEYYLMHKDILLAKIQLDESDDNAKPTNIQLNQSAFAHFPLGGQMNNMRFIEWWRDRPIPKTRQGAVPALKRLGYKSVTNAMISNLALSLNDCYWIKPANSTLRWDDVNLFQNDFSDLFGDLTFNKDKEIDLRNKTAFLQSISPLSQGEVQKKWCIAEDGRRYMVKGNYGTSYQQSINEVFATKLHEQLRFDNYTPYYFANIKTANNLDGLGCYSYNFCNENKESISAWELLQTTKIKTNQSLYHPFKEVCLSFGIPEEEFHRFVDYEIMTDFLLSNTDRHMNNIALLRNPDTLKFISFAPIYDSGNSMFYNIPAKDFHKIHAGEQETHSFITAKEVNLLQYVKDRNYLDLSLLNPNFALYEKDTPENQIRIPLLKEQFEKKIQMLRAFQKGQDIWKSIHAKSVCFSQSIETNRVKKPHGQTKRGH